MSRCSSPLPPTALRAALMRLVMVDSETTPSIPDGVDEFVLGDDAAPVGDENRENVEYPRLYGDSRPRP
jgi:hypothetical protein